MKNSITLPYLANQSCAPQTKGQEISPALKASYRNITLDQFREKYFGTVLNVWHIKAT